MVLSEYKEIVLSQVIRDKKGFSVIEPYRIPQTHGNEFVFFIKPEVTMAGDYAVSKVIDIASSVFARNSIEISGLFIAGNEYLKKHNLIEEHYGVINFVAKNGVSVLTNAPKERFRSEYGVGIDTVKVLGGFQFLDEYRAFTVDTLNDLWESGNRVKLAAGIYCEKHIVKGETIYILNGFNPYQLSFFTETGRYIIIASLFTAMDWSKMRNDIAGVTNPFKAASGSIRAEILRTKDETGIDVNPGQNGVHLSAGPFEALAELKRFCFDKHKSVVSYDDIYTGKYLKGSGLSNDKLDRAVSNPLINYNGDSVYLYDATEEKNLSSIKLFSNLI